MKRVWLVSSYPGHSLDKLDHDVVSDLRGGIGQVGGIGVFLVGDRSQIEGKIATSFGDREIWYGVGNATAEE